MTLPRVLRSGLASASLLSLACLLTLAPCFPGAPGLGVAHANDTPFRLDTPDVQMAPGAPGAIAVRVVVPEAHHVYRDMTTVTVVDAGGLSLGAPDFPSGERKPDPANPGAVREQYSDDLVVQLPVAPVAEPATHTVTLDVVYQGCKGGLCYMPSRETRTITVQVGPPDKPPRKRRGKDRKD